MKRVVEILHNALFGVVLDRRGGVATLMAAAIVPLVAFSGLAVDTARGYMMKSRLSYALDAAALAGGRAMYDPALRDEMVTRFFNANFPNDYMGATITGPTISVDSANNTMTLDAAAHMDTSMMRVVGLGAMDVAGSSEVKLSSTNVEVSLVLDVTGSMGGSRIADLKDAAKALVDIVVKDDQTPFYSKIALVPYSAAVNLGANASQVRGDIPSPLNIAGAAKTNPLGITISASTPNNFVDGEKIYIEGVNGMTQLNNIFYSVESPVTTTSFKLRNESNSSNINGTSGYSTYTSNGHVWCTVSGCEYFRFTNMNGDLRTFNPSTCVTERTGAHKYDDTAPSTALVGIHYPAPNNGCLPNTVVPLTADRTELKNQIDGLNAAGSTAGQIGLAWGWYMISPNFGYLWPNAENVAAAYGSENLVKVVIFMTDGDLNTAYAQGVVAQDSGSGSGSSQYKINQNATNGSAFDQALALCTAMKNAGILIYTVGFDVGSLPAAQNLVNSCATDSTFVFQPDSGTELADAFHTIAVNVSQLRISK